MRIPTTLWHRLIPCKLWENYRKAQQPTSFNTIFYHRRIKCNISYSPKEYSSLTPPNFPFAMHRTTKRLPHVFITGRCSRNKVNSCPWRWSVARSAYSFSERPGTGGRRRFFCQTRDVRRVEWGGTRSARCRRRCPAARAALATRTTPLHRKQADCVDGRRSHG